MHINDARPLHRRALALAGSVIDKVTPPDLGKSTPCADWDLDALLAHMIGQNHGFAAAVRGPGDAPLSAFDSRPPGSQPSTRWQASADDVADAFVKADLDRPVLLAELSAEQRFPTALVIGFQLLDTVVHGWDVATALALPFDPEPDLVAATLRVAEAVPTGAYRERPGATFAPVLPTADGAGDWHRALALLGRRPS
ncbi:TIGR03086 family metal-binding protein [Pseudonocardia acaciae]|uniref:TIGR03086 family metal-binding protein n=1 Tax=Pseudonocardia acaciae TaxID=551276 RepID=UPI00048CD67F|nr:TIGR03086 family metal-binding protein [Pseudonocardia acaciae]